MEIPIFFSWQSDLEAKTHRNFIERAIKKTNQSPRLLPFLIPILDRDTVGELGSPNIMDTIFRKINQCALYICDISFVDEMNRPNSNVLIELGYAISSLGWEKIICLFDSNTGSVDNLPFNINHNRITTYNPACDNEIKRLSNIFAYTIMALFDNGTIYEPISDYFKGKIDYFFLQIQENIVEMFSHKKNEYSLAEEVQRLSSLGKNELEEELSNAVFIGFYCIQDYSVFEGLLEQRLQDLYNTNLFRRPSKSAIVELIQWTYRWSYLCSGRDIKDLFRVVDNHTKYVIKDHTELKSVSTNDCVLIEINDRNTGTVIRGGHIHNYYKSYANKLIRISEEHCAFVSQLILDFFSILEKWVDTTGGQFILDPKYYTLK